MTAHCLDSMHINTPPRNTMGKQTLLMKDKTNSNLESIERHGMATMKTTKKVIIKKNNNNQISNGLSCLSRDWQQQQFVHSMKKRTMMYFKEFFTIHSRRWLGCQPERKWDVYSFWGWECCTSQSGAKEDRKTTAGTQLKHLFHCDRISDRKEYIKSIF